MSYDKNPGYNIVSKDKYIPPSYWPLIMHIIIV